MSLDVFKNKYYYLHLGTMNCHCIKKNILYKVFSFLGELLLYIPLQDERSIAILIIGV